MYVYYCPICGGINRRDKSTYICRDCQSTIPDAKSEHEIDYYEQKSVTLYDTSKFWNYIFWEEEIKKNPFYDESKVPQDAMSKIDKQRQEIQAVIERQENRRKNAGFQYFGYQNFPCCPFCNSTNVKKISDMDRINMRIAGLASTEIEKQNECGNCGKKF